MRRRGSTKGNNICERSKITSLIISSPILRRCTAINLNKVVTSRQCYAVREGKRSRVPLKMSMTEPRRVFIPVRKKKEPRFSAASERHNEIARRYKRAVSARYAGIVCPILGRILIRTDAGAVVKGPTVSLFRNFTRKCTGETANDIVASR